MLPLAHIDGPHLERRAGLGQRDIGHERASDRRVIQDEVHLTLLSGWGMSVSTGHVQWTARRVPKLWHVSSSRKHLPNLTIIIRLDAPNHQPLDYLCLPPALVSPLNDAASV